MPKSSCTRPCVTVCHLLSPIFHAEAGILDILCDLKTEVGKHSIPLFDKLKPFLSDQKDLILPDNNEKLCSEAAFNNVWRGWKNQIEKQMNNCTQKRWYFI